MIRVSRSVLIALMIIIALAMLLVPRKEGATTASKGQCYNSMMAYNEDTGKFGTGVGPPLDPSKCKNVVVKMGGKCYRSNGSAWNPSETSKTCHSWVKLVDWKSSRAKNRYPIYGSYKKLNGLWKGGDLGPSFKDKTVEQCGAECDANVACTGFTFAKPKGVAKTFECWLRNNANTNINKTDKTWYSYDKNAGGSGAPTASTSDTAAADCAVELYEHDNFKSGTKKCFAEDEYSNLAEWNDKATAMKVKPGYVVDVFDKADFNKGDGNAKYATITSGDHILWSEEIKKLQYPSGAHGWSDVIASMKVRKA